MEDEDKELPKADKPKRVRRSYTPEDKAAGLTLLKYAADMDAPQSYVRHVTGLPQRTVSDWAAGKGVSDEVKEIAVQNLESIAELCEKAIRKGFASLLANDDQVRWRDVTALAILIDKRQLLTGEATQITATLTSEQRQQRIAELVAKAKVS